MGGLRPAIFACRIDGPKTSLDEQFMPKTLITRKPDCAPLSFEQERESVSSRGVLLQGRVTRELQPNCGGLELAVTAEVSVSERRLARSALARGVGKRRLAAESCLAW